MDRRRLMVIFLIVLVDVLGFGLILPLLPFYAKQFGVTSQLLIGLLASSYAVASLIGSPLLGRLSDRYGRRPILLVSIAGSLVGYVILGIAGAFWMLFLSRIVDGLTAGNFTVAQSYITDVTDAKNRARGLGLTGAAFGLGFLIGPPVGGLLTEHAAAWAAVAMTALNMILVFFLLPESLSQERRDELAAQPRGGVTLGKLLEALQRPRFGPALILRGGFWSAFAIFQGAFSLWAIQALHASSEQVGFVLGYVGLVSVLVQVLLIKPLTDRFAEGWLAVVSLAAASVTFVVWGFTGSWWFLLVVLLVLGVAIAVQNTVASSLLSKSVAPWEVGGAFGLAGALQSVGNAIAPTAGGALLQGVAVWAPGVVAGLLAAALIPFVYSRFVKGSPDLGQVQGPGGPVEELRAEEESLGPEIDMPPVASDGMVAPKDDA